MLCGLLSPVHVNGATAAAAAAPGSNSVMFSRSQVALKREEGRLCSRGEAEPRGQS